MGGDRSRPGDRRPRRGDRRRRAGKITRIFATHTHTDHSPATVALQARTGATVHGLAARHREWQDATFVPT
jgi:glyoxylase-like metal-dependent hydrolase (beta-lactamase superfamily II)